MLAVFLGLRLYAVLGRRAEHEEETIQGRIDDKSGAVGNRPPSLRLPAQNGQISAELPRDAALVVPAVERALLEIAGADRRFDLTSFVEGARGAYRMILEAFWRGDKDELAQLCDRDVFDGFAQAIDARVAAGEQLENRLIRIEETQVTAASFDAPFARISVRFIADIASVTRNADGQVIAGSLNDAIVSQDVWTFSRNVKSTAPDWLLDEADEG